jgi:uncharacterized protein YegP (UPF0339 family)
MLEQIEPTAKPVVTAEELLACLFAEYQYWRDFESKEDHKDGIAIGATGVISNVIAFATVKNFRADWHPEKMRSKRRSMRFEIYLDDRGRWQFFILDDELAEIASSSDGYETADECVAIIQQIQQKAAGMPIYHHQEVVIPKDCPERQVTND